MVTFRGHHGHDGKAPLIDGFEVLLNEHVVGFIWPGGSFSRRWSCGDDLDMPLTEEDILAIREKCAKVSKMPSEYGWIGVGDPPAEAMHKSVFFISPVRGIMRGEDPELKARLQEYVTSLENQGYKVHWPLRDTPQIDPTGGFVICRTNCKAIIDADEIHIWYDESSNGSKFDMGGVFMLCEMESMRKKIVIANENEIVDTAPKSFFKVFKRLAAKSAETA